MPSSRQRPDIIANPGSAYLFSFLLCFIFVQPQPAWPSQTGAEFQRAPLSPVLKKHHLAFPDCGLVDRDSTATSLKFFTYPLGQKTRLYGILCDGGSYNTSFAIYLVRDKNYHNAQRLYFPAYSKEQGWSGQNTLANASYDPDTRILGSTTRYDAQKDCGNKAKYLWTGHSFRLQEYWVKEKCSQNSSGQWPLAYSFATVLPRSKKQRIRTARKPRSRRYSQRKKRLVARLKRKRRLKRLKRIRYLKRRKYAKRRARSLRLAKLRKRRLRRRFRRLKRRKRRRKG